MAVVELDIGGGDNDYSTIQAWADDLDDSGIYSSADDAVGNVYDKGSGYDEAVDVSAGGTVGIASKKLTVPTAERHDGSEGTGARMVATADNRYLRLSSGGSSQGTVEWLEVNGGGNQAISGIRIDDGCEPSTVRYCLVCHYEITASVAAIWIVGTSNDEMEVCNNLIYDIELKHGSSNDTAAIKLASNGSGNKYILNNTVYNVRRTSGAGSGGALGIWVVNDEAGYDIKNNICIDCEEADYSGTFTSADTDKNMSSDTTAPGSTTYHSETAAGIFTAPGSDDLSLKASTNAVGNGVDLGTTPSGVEIPVNGGDGSIDRDADALDWDLGGWQTASSTSEVSQTFSAGTESLATAEASHSAGAEALATAELEASSGVEALATAEVEVVGGVESLATAEIEASAGVEVLAEAAFESVAGVDISATVESETSAAVGPLAEVEAETSSAVQSIESASQTFDAGVEALAEASQEFDGAVEVGGGLEVSQTFSSGVSTLAETSAEMSAGVESLTSVEAEQSAGVSISAEVSTTHPAGISVGQEASAESISGVEARKTVEFTSTSAVGSRLNPDALIQDVPIEFAAALQDVIEFAAPLRPTVEFGAPTEHTIEFPGGL